MKVQINKKEVDMKILFIGSNPKNIGGIETFGRNLKKIFSDNILFFSYERQNTGIYDVSDVFEFKKKKYHPKFLRKKIQNYTEKKYLKEVIEKIKPTIFILNTPQDLKLLDGIEGKKILVQHRTASQYWETDSYFNKENNLLERVKKEVDKIVTLSPYDKEKFIKKFILDEKKVISIRHMSEISEFKTKKLKTKKLVIISRITNSKRIDLAIKAMCKLSDYELNIYGDGPDKSILERLVKKLTLKNIKFYGITDKVKEKLDENSIFIMTSNHEGYPLTTIEAMRRGLPLILRDTFTSAKDIINGNGILLEKEWDENKFIEGIEKIYNNYEEYSKKSVEMGKRHSYEVIKKEWKTLLEN